MAKRERAHQCEERILKIALTGGDVLELVGCRSAPLLPYKRFVAEEHSVSEFCVSPDEKKSVKVSSHRLDG